VYINEIPFYGGALRRLQDSGRTPACRISRPCRQSTCEFKCGEKGSVHIGAVIADRGAWGDYLEYAKSDRYAPREPLVAMKRLFPQLLTSRMPATTSLGNIGAVFDPATYLLNYDAIESDAAPVLPVHGSDGQSKHREDRRLLVQAAHLRCTDAVKQASHIRAKRPTMRG